LEKKSLKKKKSHLKLSNKKSTEIQCFFLVAGTGLEPVTFGLWGVWNKHTKD